MTRGQRIILTRAAETGTIRRNPRRPSAYTVDALTRRGYLRHLGGLAYAVTNEGRQALAELPPEPTVEIAGESFVIEEEAPGVILVREYRGRPFLTDADWSRLLGRRCIGALGTRWGTLVYVEEVNGE